MVDGSVSIRKAVRKGISRYRYKLGMNKAMLPHRQQEELANMAAAHRAQRATIHSLAAQVCYNASSRSEYMQGKGRERSQRFNHSKMLWKCVIYKYVFFSLPLFFPSSFPLFHFSISFFHKVEACIHSEVAFLMYGELCFCLSL